MKKIIILLLFFNFKHSLAQLPTNHIPTQFDKFIERPEIDWAVYKSDTIRFPKINLNEYLRTQFQKEKIKVAANIVSISLRANEIIYADKKMINDKYFPLLDPIIDSFGNIRNREAFEKESRTPVNRFDSSVNDLLYLTEILYIEKNKLKSYIAWVSPQTAIYTSSDLFLGTCDYFLTAFNFDDNFEPAKNDNIIDLGKTQRQFFTDSFTSNDRIKELYGRNLIETLWPYVLNNKLEIFSLKTNKKLTPTEMDINLAYETPVMVPLFDSLGNEIGNKPMTGGSILEYISKIEMTQECYYDVSKNIVYNKIPEIILFSRSPWYENPDLKPILKIVFKN
ncbi:MAG: hypothetical protein ABI402_18880 [Ferruginibacter sp.]